MVLLSSTHHSALASASAADEEKVLLRESAPLGRKELRGPRPICWLLKERRLVLARQKGKKHITSFVGITVQIDNSVKSGNTVGASTGFPIISVTRATLWSSSNALRFHRKAVFDHLFHTGIYLREQSMEFRKESPRAIEGSDALQGPAFFPSDLSAETAGIVPQELAEQIVYEALAWASLHGLVIGDKAVEDSGKIPGVGLVHAPISLLPSPFTERHFKQAIDLAPLFNELVDLVSMDGKFLQEALWRTSRADTFTAKLLDIHSMVMREGIKQDVCLGLHRSDYMVDMHTGDLLQVEMNTISSSFAGLGSRVVDLHRYLVEYIRKCSNLQSKKIPENKAIDGFAKALALAFKEFGKTSAVVLMVVQPEERNMYDQYWLSTKLYDSYGITVIRRTLAEVHSEAIFHPDDTFSIGGQTVAVVYYRAGYSPNDYPSDNEWNARTLIERTKAIKCPTIAYHLAGTKKIQQELAKPGVLERFLQDTDAISKLRSCFAGLWGLDDETGLEMIEKAITNPNEFVLKPQREGGGNNLFGEDIRRKLIELKAKDGGESFAAYILMQRIFPPIHTTYFIRSGKFSAQEAVSELGIFAAYIRHGNEVILNEHSGYLLRTKASSTNEGGVAAGFAVLDSVYLTEGPLK